MGSGRQLRALLSLAFFGLAGVAPRAVHAQGIEGTVRHQATGEPLPGVLVSLLDVGGERVRGVLTDGSGGFTIEVPLGRYRLRAERIGLRTETTDTFDLNTFNMRFERIEMAERAVEIAGFVIDTRVQSCRSDPEVATRIQRWWLEIRTALDVSAALQREQFGRFLVEKFEREWDRDARELIASNRHVEVSESTRPFVSVAADELAEEGFVRGTVGAERLYYGPDADVLLSNIFLSQHCFSLVEERDRADQLGLRFEPVEGREVADIEGTLWVDTTTAELQDLDFRYANLEGPESGEAGGKIVFDYLPSGAWIVSDWYIRMPKLGVRRRSRIVTVGYLDGGGSVTPLTPPPPGGPVGTIRGVVVDSLRGGGLADAVVTILGTSRRTLTDDDGAFRFFEVPAGVQHLGFAHHEVDIWGLGTGAVAVDVAAGMVTETELALPSFERTALALCLGRGVGAETVVVGHVLRPTREPQAHLAIQLLFERRGRRGAASLVEFDLRTDESGRFVACGVPADEPVTLRLDVGDGWADVADFVPRAGEVTYREVWFSR